MTPDLATFLPAAAGMRDMAAAFAPGTLPLIDAQAARRVAVAAPGRQQALGPHVLQSPRLPAVVVLGDTPCSAGPNGWACAKVAACWARAAIVHAAGEDPAHYAAAVEAAEQHGRLLLIETAPERVGAWARIVAGRPTLILSPHFPHPTLAGGALH